MINISTILNLSPHLRVRDLLELLRIGYLFSSLHTWVTDIRITNENIYELMRGGRANWTIENHAFNTLKNQGYHFGHGYQHLCTNVGMLLMLAFSVDHIQELCCELFKKARAEY